MSNPYKLSLSGATAALALSFGMTAVYAHAQDPAGSAPGAEAPAPPSVDTDKDGKPDAWDRDANGIADAWDTDGDGKPDKFDDDGDGKPDSKKPTR